VDKLFKNGGQVYLCTTAGTSAASGGPTGTGASITDGSVVWKYVRQDDLPVLTQAAYDAHWAQLAEYCGDNGLFLYPALCQVSDFNYFPPVNYQNPAVTASVVSTAAVLSKYPNVIAFDVFQEGLASGVPWEPNTVYTTQFYVNLVTNGGNLYTCTTAGTSAASGGPTGTGASITDGTAVWKYSGVPLLAADVLALMAAVRDVSGVPLTMSSALYTNISTSTTFWRGVKYNHYQVNADPAGSDFIDLHFYDSNVRAEQLSTYLSYFKKPLMIGEFGVGQDLSSADQVARYALPVAVHQQPGVLGSFVWALADQGTSNANKFGCWDNTGFVQGSAPLSTSAGQRANLVGKLNELAVATPNQDVFSLKPVCVTAAGAGGVEDGANTWAKIATVSPGSNAYGDVQLMLAFTASNTGAHDSAIVSAKFRTNASAANPTVDVQIIAKGGAGGLIATDSFKIVSGGFGTNMELWLKKAAAYGTFVVHELARNGSSGSDQRLFAPVTYSTTPAWQSAVPTGAVNNVSSNGVTAFNDPLVTATNTVTMTNKTIQSPLITNPKINQIMDTNGGVAVRFPATVLLGDEVEVDPVPDSKDAKIAANFFDISNAAAGGAVGFFARGSDTDIAINVMSKGKGMIKVRNDNGVIIEAAADQPASINYLKVSAGVAGAGVTLQAGGGSGANEDLILAASLNGSVRSTHAMVAKNFRAASVTVPTTGGVTGLTDVSAQMQVLTGTMSHTIQLPSPNIKTGWQYTITNQSTGVVTVWSGTNVVVGTIPAGQSVTFSALIDTPSLPAHWHILNAGDAVRGSQAGTPTPLTLWTGTKSQYDAIATKSATTIYVVTAVTAVTGDITVDEGAETGDIAVEPPTEERAAPATKSTRKK